MKVRQESCFLPITSPPEYAPTRPLTLIATNRLKVREQLNYLAFMSYSRADNLWFIDVAPCIQQTLSELAMAASVRAGVRATRIFWDQGDMPPNGPLPDHLRAALQRSEFFVAILGCGYARSRWCRFEFEEFMSRFADDTEGLARIFSLVLEREALTHSELPDALSDDNLHVRFFDEQSGATYEHFVVDVGGTRHASPLLVRELRCVVAQMVDKLHASP